MEDFQRMLEELFRGSGFYPVNFKVIYTGGNDPSFKADPTNVYAKKEKTLGDLLKEKEHELNLAEREERYEDCAKIHNEITDLRENYEVKNEKRIVLRDQINLAVKEKRYMDAAKFKKELEELV